MLYYFKKGKNVAETHKKICAAYADGAVTDQTCQKWFAGLPWWHSGEESACQCREHGFEPWSGKIPHAAKQLSSCATTTEPAL